MAALVVSPHFHNPLGSLMPDAHKEALVALLAKHGVPAIEDDTCGELYFGEVRPRSLRSFDREGLVLSCGSFSKTLAPAYRVGWAVPGRFHGAMRRLKAAGTMATSLPPQLAIAEYLRKGGYEHHLRTLRRTFAQNLERLGSEVADRFPEGTRITQPTGGFVLWVELPGDVDTIALHQRALNHGVSTAPGPVFSPSGGYRNCLRLSAGHPWSPRTEGALDTLARLIDGLRRR